MDIYGLIVLTIVLIVVSAFESAAIFGVMFALHKFAAEKLPHTTYGDFDFDTLQKAQLTEFLSRLGAMVFAPTLVIHLLEFMIMGVYLRAHPGLITAILFVLETAALAAGFHFFLKIDPLRTTILTAAGALVYLFLYWLMLYAYLQ